MSEKQLLPTEKNETIAKLYALRAGLSVVAENTEMVKNIEKNYDNQSNDLKAQIERNNDVKYELEEDLRDVQSEQEAKRRYSIGELERRIEKENITKKAGEFSLRENQKRTKILVLSIFALVILVILTHVADTMDVTGLLYLLGVLLILGDGINIIVQIVFLIQNRGGKKEMENASAALTKLQKELDQLNRSPAPSAAFSTNEQWKRIKKENAELQHQIQMIDIDKRNDVQKQAFLQKNQTIYHALLATYTPLIVEADWKNIDLLIFYLETGRAESWKEALQLADRQQQTNQITAAIKQASESISVTIRRSTEALGSLMAQSFSDLRSEIRQVGWQMSADIQVAMGEQSRQNTALLAQGKEAISEARLQSALLAKANQSSEDLMYELRYNQRFWVK